MTGFGLSLVCSVWDPVATVWLCILQGIIFPLRKKPEFAITASRWGLNACVWVIISLLYTCPWIACECFGSWILGIGVTGQTIWPLVVPFECLWYFLNSDILWSLIGKSFGCVPWLSGFSSYATTLPVPRCLPRWWPPKNMTILSWERRECPAQDDHDELYLHGPCLNSVQKDMSIIRMVVTYYVSRIHIRKHLQSRMDRWDTGLLSQPTEVLSGTERTGLVWFASHVCNVGRVYLVNWDAQIISIHIRLSNHCVQEIFDPAENLW